MKIAGSLIDVNLLRVSFVVSVQPSGGAGSRGTELPHKKARPPNCHRRTRQKSRDDQAASKVHRETQKGHRLAHTGDEADERWQSA